MREKGVKDDLNGGWTDTGRAKAGACLRSKHKFGFGIWSLRCREFGEKSFAGRCSPF